MSDSEMFVGSQEKFGSELGWSGAKVAGQSQQSGVADVKELEHIVATGLGSRGGPNKESNKFKRCPSSYLSL